MSRIFFIVSSLVVASVSTALAETTHPIVLSPVQPAWIKVCGSEKNVCYTVRDFRLVSRQSPVVAMAVYEDLERHSYVLRLMLPTSLRTDIDVNFSVDGGPNQKAGIKVCLPTGCLAQARFDTYIASLKQGRSMQIVATSAMNKSLILNVPLAGFAPVFDGAGISYEESKRRYKPAPKRPQLPPSETIVTPL
jgi:invasion protein IalB